MCGFFPDWGNVSEKWWIIYVTPVRTERQGDMMGSENILCVKGIKKSFGGVHALKGVDLTIKRGETHCLAGENGCGKSTIIKVISGFYKPDAGSIEVDGKGFPIMTPAEASTRTAAWVKDVPLPKRMTVVLATGIFQNKFSSLLSVK